ncbi:hypothetical protein L2E82_06735 [Cichorium intybus]|uniref:Uncharacterized protein n=1 Tax=Cichorium intybus TaxID=13427 RepID=A0ACB9HAW2_CICIN|nr:hypothetical protein L2E82_06735 [Cichorium intybus]
MESSTFLLFCSATVHSKFCSMGWGSIYIRRMKVFSLAFLIYLDYKALKHREKWINSSERAALWEKTHERNAKRIVNLIIELEGLWVKMGQYFSVRADGLPGAYPRHLKQLQDSLPPRCLKEVHKTIKTEMGKSIDDLFANFVEKPLATASIAQVHRATLRDGKEVVVKVQHEGIKTIILEDLKNAKSVVEWIVWAEPKFNFNPIIDEWCKEAPKELDFNREAENTRKVSSNLGCKKELLNIRPEHRVKVLMPEVIHSTERVLILEYMDGVRLNDTQSLDKLGVDKRNIVEEITRAYAHQIFIDGFFNADPHPGNFLVTKSSPHHPILLDFGFTKMLSSSMKHAVAKMFLASAELDNFTGEIVLFLRVLNLLAGLSATLNVSVSYYRIIRPFAESALDCDPNELTVDKAEWICDSPVNSQLEKKLRALLVRLGNADKILGIQVCAYKDGEVIIDTAAGVLGNYDPSPVKPDTLFPVFSVTKGVTAGMLHWLVDKGKLKLEDNVADIWPDFSSNRKESIKVHHVLNHTSGLQNALASLVQDNPMVLCNWDECLKRIAMAEAESEPGKDQQYHYLSYGWLCGGIIEHASNKRFQDILLEAFIQPLKIEGELYIGIPPGVESRLATLTLDTNDLNRFAEIDSPTSISSPTSLSSSSSSSIFQLDVLSGLVPLFNTLNVRRAILPAANGHCSARALARYYAALVDGGVVPPPHSSSSQPPLGSHPHLPGSISVAIADKKKGGKKKKQKKEKRCSGSSCAINPSCSDDVDFFQACKIFSNQKAQIHDSILGIGEYEKLVFPDGKFGLGFKREQTRDGILIGFGHSGLGGSTSYCDISNRFAIAVTLNKLSFGSVTRDIIQFVCSELNIPVPDQYADSGFTSIN